MLTRGEPPLRPQTLLRQLFAGSGMVTTLQALERAAARARDLGFVVLPLGLQAPADVNELAKFHAAIALQCVRDGHPMAPTAMISGGPLLAKTGLATHAEFLLALALAFDGHGAIYAYACGPDVTREESTAWGAQIGPDTLVRARQLQVNVGQSLAASNAKSVFKLLGEEEKLPLDAAQASVLRAILVI